MKFCIAYKKYDRTDISEGIDVNRTDKSKEYMFSHYWYFLNKKQEIVTRTCQKKKKTKSRSIKRKGIKN